MEQFKYIWGNLLSLPLFPILYQQGKQIQKTIPRLPEAQQPEGHCGKQPYTLRLLGLGESTIAGVGVERHEQGFTSHLAKTLAESLNTGIQWKVVAKSGYTARKVVDKLLPHIKEDSFDIIIIGLGGNDTFKLTSPNRWKEDIEKLIQQLQQDHPNTPIVFTNLPPIRSFPAFSSVVKFVLGRQLDLLHSTLKKVVAQKEQVWFVEQQLNVSEWIKKPDFEKYQAKDFFSDGVHPSELTYKAWGSEVARFIIREKVL